MKKEYIIGGLALLGVIGVVSYLNKPKRNSEGFFGANGRASKRLSLASGGGCTVCDGGFSNYYARGGRCRQGDRCVR
jgi:hypothetical protein